ncbi:hypothetical protein RCL1_008733 [Eukaryota sp. TZLM3-RCL]
MELSEQTTLFPEPTSFTLNHDQRKNSKRNLLSKFPHFCNKNDLNCTFFIISFTKRGNFISFHEYSNDTLQEITKDIWENSLQSLSFESIELSDDLNNDVSVFFNSLNKICSQFNFTVGCSFFNLEVSICFNYLCSFISHDIRLLSIECLKNFVNAENYNLKYVKKYQLDSRITLLDETITKLSEGKTKLQEKNNELSEQLIILNQQNSELSQLLMIKNFELAPQSKPSTSVIKLGSKPLFKNTWRNEVEEQSIDFNDMLSTDSLNFFFSKILVYGPSSIILQCS